MEHDEGVIVLGETMTKNDTLDLDQLNLKKRDYSNAILVSGIAVGALVFILGYLDAIGIIDTPLEWIDFVFIGLMIITGPYGFYTSSRQRRIRDIEARLPDFLRDVAEAGRFGMTLAEAIKAASKGRYGRLSPEIRRMAAQIDWGVPASDAMRLFAERVDSPLVKRVTSIIIKANDAGGHVSDVLTMASHDVRESILDQKREEHHDVHLYCGHLYFVRCLHSYCSDTEYKLFPADEHGWNVDNQWIEHCFLSLACEHPGKYHTDHPDPVHNIRGHTRDG